MTTHTYKTSHYTFEFGPYEDASIPNGTIKISNKNGNSFFIMTQELLEFVCATWVSPGMKKHRERQIALKKKELNLEFERIQEEQHDFLSDLFGFAGSKTC